MADEIVIPLTVDQYVDNIGVVVGVNDSEVVRRHCRARELRRLKAVKLEGGGNKPWVIYVKMVDIPLQQRKILFENPLLPDQARRGVFEGVKTLLKKHNPHVNYAGSIEPRHWPELLAHYSHWQLSATGTMTTSPTGRAGSISGASP